MEMSVIQKRKKECVVKTSNTRICSFLIADVFMFALKCAVVCRKICTVIVHLPNPNCITQCICLCKCTKDMLDFKCLSHLKDKNNICTKIIYSRGAWIHIIMLIYSQGLISHFKSGLADQIQAVLIYLSVQMVQSVLHFQEHWWFRRNCCFNT